MMLASFMDALFVPRDATNIAALAHCDAVRRGHPLHHRAVGRGRRWRSSRANNGPNFKTDRRTRFVGDIQTALGEQILDVAIAEREADIEPNGVPDDRRRELVAG